MLQAWLDGQYDASLGLTIGDPSVPRSSADYRALIFVNGWNMGQYIANVDPRHSFVVPNGVLDRTARCRPGARVRRAALRAV
jgi:hypothetical protein